MGLTFPDVLSAAKDLANRLKDHDMTSDKLLAEAQSVYNKVEAMKQYGEDLNHLNNLTSDRPRLALVAGIQQESKHIMELQQENRELRITLEEQQNAMDLIMSKYRQQVAKLVDNKQYDEKLLKSIDTNTQVLKTNKDEINEMKCVMRSAIEMDELAIRRQEEVLSCLWKENRGLREILQISSTFGSYNTNPFVVVEEKGVQTEDDSLNTTKDTVLPSEIS